MNWIKRRVYSALYGLAIGWLSEWDRARQIAWVLVKQAADLSVLAKSNCPRGGGELVSTFAVHIGEMAELDDTLKDIAAEHDSEPGDAHEDVDTAKVVTSTPDEELEKCGDPKCHCMQDKQ